MRRTAALLAPITCIALTWLPASSAQAATTVVSDTGLPAGMVVDEQSACSGTAGGGSYTHIKGPATPPLGVGSLRLTTGSSPESYGVDYDFPASTAASALTALSVAHYEPGQQGALATFNIFLTSGAHTDQLGIDPAAFTTGTWQQSNLLTATLFWFRDSTVQSTNTSWTSYINANPDATLQVMQAFATSCSPAPSGADTMYIDDWSIGLNGTTTTYDFEPTKAAVGISVSSGTITAGHSVTVKGTLTSHGHAVSGVPLQLWAKTFPATSYSKVTTLTTDSLGHVQTSKKPVVQTTYQWRLADPDYGSARSVTKTVSVHTKLTYTVADKTLHATQKFVMYGGTTPKRPGAEMSLLRVTPKGDVLVEHASVTKDGTYFFSHLLPKGTDKVFARIPAGAGDLSGHTPTVTVTVS
jgi:hypothetical protein